MDPFEDNPGKKREVKSGEKSGEKSDSPSSSRNDSPSSNRHKRVDRSSKELAEARSAARLALRAAFHVEDDRMESESEVYFIGKVIAGLKDSLSKF